MRTRAAVVVALLLALGACSRSRPFTVAVIGDFGRDNPDEAAVAELVRSWSPELVATVGDNNYPDGAADTIDRNIGKYYHDFIGGYRGSFGAGSARNRFFPALGNHDWRLGNAQAHLDYFELPGNERYYDVRQGELHLFVVDSDTHEPDGVTFDSAQAGWLREALAKSTAPYKLVFFHHPPFSSGPHGSTPELQWPFRAWGATAVLSGHDHDYERLERDGMPYVVVGTGGAKSYEFGAPVAGSVVRLEARHGALRIDVAGDTARGRFLAPGNVELDAFELPRAERLPVPRALVATGSHWQLLDGAPPGDDWPQPRFDATAWATVSTPFRVIDRGAAAGAQPHSTYARTRFEVAAPQMVGSLELGLPRGQESVAYLNGAEVARVTPRPAEKWLLPRGARGVAEPALLQHVAVDGAALRVGENVLAIETRWLPAETPDSGFAAELDAFEKR
jgi:hypothetical protein